MRRSHLPFFLLSSVIAAGVGCARHERARTGAQTSVSVEVDGVVQAPLDAAGLAKWTPERRHARWRLWRLARLIDVDLAGAALVLDYADGTRGGFAAPQPGAAADVWLAADDEGRAALVLAAPSAQRLPSLDVAAASARFTGIRITTATRRSALTRRDAGCDDVSLSITFADGRVAKWTSADLERVAQREREPTERGDVPAWSLRDVVATFVDKDARVAAIANAAGETSTISTAAWLDLQRAPVLRANQRGLWKFDWIDATTKQPMRDGRLRNVTALRIASVEREASLAVR